MVSEIIGWIGNLILVVAQWKVGDKARTAFLLMVVGELTWLVASILKESPSMSFLCVIFAGIAMRNYWKWK